MANSKSVPKIRIGSLKAAILPNDTEGRIRYTITFSHLYKDGEQWKTTQTFDRNDLLILAKVPDQAHTRIFKLQQGSGAHEEEHAPESGGPGRRFPSITGGPNRDAHTIKIRAIDQKQHCATHRLEHPRMGRPLLLALQRHTIPFSALPSSVPSRSGNRIHSPKKRFSYPGPHRSFAVAMGTGYTHLADA